MNVGIKIVIGLAAIVVMFYMQSGLVSLLWKLDETFFSNETGIFSAIAFVFNPMGLGLLVLPITAFALYWGIIKLVRRNDS